MVEKGSTVINKLIIVCCIIIISSVMISCEKEDPETLDIAEFRTALLSPIYIAEVKGYFEEENLTVNLIQKASGKNCLESILSDEADIAAAIEFPVVKNIISGESLKILSTVHRTTQNKGLVVRTDHGIEKFSDLTGKRVGMLFGSSSEYLIDLLLNSVGLTRDDIVLVDVKPGDSALAIAQGQVDAVLTWSPYVEKSFEALDEGAGTILRIPIYTELSVMAGEEEVIEEKEEALYRFYRALLKAESYILKHNAEALEDAIGFLDEIPEQSIRDLWPSVSFQIKLDNVLLRQIENEAEWILEGSDDLDEQYDMKERISDRFLREAAPESVTYDFSKE